MRKNTAEEKKEARQRWRDKYRERENQRSRDYYKLHRDHILEYHRAWEEKNKERQREQQKRYRAANAERFASPEHRKWRADYRRAANLELKLGVIAAYGGCCECCGVADFEFLTLDHINGDGKQHRAEVGIGAALYAWLKRSGYPKGQIRLLCWNCNCARAYFPICPHQKEVRDTPRVPQWPESLSTGRPRAKYARVHK